VVVLLGYVISGERTIEGFYERLQPFASPFMALFGRERLPHRSTLSRFLAALDQAPVEALRALFLEDLVAQPKKFCTLKIPRTDLSRTPKTRPKHPVEKSNSADIDKYKMHKFWAFYTLFSLPPDTFLAGSCFSLRKEKYLSCLIHAHPSTAPPAP
jgi:hypothetical protein